MLEVGVKRKNKMTNKDTINCHDVLMTTASNTVHRKEVNFINADMMPPNNINIGISRRE